MKKSLLLCGTLAVLLIGGTATSCGKSNESNVIKIQFVPSNDPDTLGALAKRLEPVLHQITPKYEYEISVGTSYNATTEGLLSNQLDIGFLTASGYAQATLQDRGKIQVLLTSVRKGYKVQVEDYKDNTEMQIKAMNGEIEGYTYLGEQSDVDVNWYSSQLSVGNKYYKDVNGDGKIDVKDLAGLKIGRMGATSGAGYLRPLKYLNDYGMKMVDQAVYDSASEEEKKTMIIGVEQTDYGAAFNNTQDGTIAGFWGFTDVRYAQGYIKSGSKYYQKAEAFTLSKVVAITDGIYNDTISSRSNLSKAKKEAVMEAFKTAVTMEEKIEGQDLSPKEILYKVYSHTGYTEAKDADFEGEREFYQYCVDHDLI